MENRRQIAFDGLTLGVGYQLLDRAENGTGLTVYAEPYWSRVDQDTGSLSEGFGADFTIAISKEPVPGKIMGVFNLLYQPVVGRPSTDGFGPRQATAGFSGGVAFKLTSDLYATLEGRY